MLSINESVAWIANRRNLASSSNLISVPKYLTVVTAPHMTLQQYSYTFPCLPLPSVNLQTPLQSIFYVIFLSLFLSSSPSCSFQCVMQNCLRHARGSGDVAIPSKFLFCFTMVRSSCTLVAFWILLLTSSFVK